MAVPLLATLGDLTASLGTLTLALAAFAFFLWIIDFRLCEDDGHWSLKNARLNVEQMFENPKRPFVHSVPPPRTTSVRNLPLPPTPFPLPVLGHLHLLAAYPTNPWAGFDAIRQKYGNVVRLRLGQYPTVLVSSPEAIREVLISKGDLFADRPHFERHALIFGRDRQNALALCDWSDIHRARRSIAHAAVIPRLGTGTYNRLGQTINYNVQKLLNAVSFSPEKLLQKSEIVELCCAVFIEFLLERSVDQLDRVAFKDLCTRYDFIFHDINQMYLCDFLPGLAPVTARSYLKHVETNAMTVRNFIDSIVLPRLEELKRQHSQKKQQDEIQIVIAEDRKLASEFDAAKCEERFVDQILLHKQYQSKAQFLDFIIHHYLENESSMTWDECLYEIGDLVGGNSAVANLCFRLLGHLAINPQIQEDLFQEAKLVASQTGCDWISIEQQSQMPLTTAAILETLRHASSPIVPHLARTDASIQGHFIPKGTMVLFNIFHSNFDPALWTEPEAFQPARFVNAQGMVQKPDYFIPFSHGRRSCLGYKMVNVIVFAVTANLLLRYRLSPRDANEEKHIRELLRTNGSISLPYDGTCFRLALSPRN